MNRTLLEERLAFSTWGTPCDGKVRQGDEPTPEVIQAALRKHFTRLEDRKDLLSFMWTSEEVLGATIYTIDLTVRVEGNREYQRATHRYMVGVEDGGAPCIL